MSNQVQLFSFSLQFKETKEDRQNRLENPHMFECSGASCVKEVKKNGNIYRYCSKEHHPECITLAVKASF